MSTSAVVHFDLIVPRRLTSSSTASRLRSNTQRLSDLVTFFNSDSYASGAGCADNGHVESTHLSLYQQWLGSMQQASTTVCSLDFIQCLTGTGKFASSLSRDHIQNGADGSECLYGWPHLAQLCGSVSTVPGRLSQPPVTSWALTAPRVHMALGTRKFAVCGPTFWNNLRDGLRHSAFVKWLITHLFDCQHLATRCALVFLNNKCLINTFIITDTRQEFSSFLSQTWKWNRNQLIQKRKPPTNL